ncbi:hypothetical protein D8674_039909 [Pyrus ussuriensis x Pyrus communis]|uniref:Retrotransposon Copia-like N-terminal domain-containing protein n=1 Tax=Pyrus ussuriensis x Pyrus communis TaxID=2448454 RepID=A0A5N5H6M9_9ROSA|nr:hypothetical protein D8674_039909 [Pyrus ussuriensis x Pyrus communis]
MAEDISFSSEATSSSTLTPVRTVQLGESNPRLCSVLLNEFNYLPWSRAISLALGGRSKLGYLLRFSHILWESIKEMYGSQHNAARVFELKKSLAGLKQGNQTFIQHLGSMKSMWNELDLYRPHTTESAALLKRADEDKVFQLLASLGVEYEDLRSHLLMTPELPSFVNVCHAVQREETRRKVMHVEPRSSPEARAFTSNHNFTSERLFNGKKADWKCSYCNTKGHVREKCWILHPELKPKFNKEGKMIRDGKGCPSKEMSNFTSSPISLINEFAAFLQKKSDIAEGNNVTTEKSTEMLGKFAGFLANSNTTTSGNIPGSSHSEEDW